MRVYYFGCIGGPGHFLWTPDMQTQWRVPGMPWHERQLDGALVPGAAIPYHQRREEQGLAGLHHLGGWTALAFWDRSVDRRGACNSGFYADATLDAEAMIAAAREAFPRVWARFPFAVRVVEVDGVSVVEGA